MKSAVFFLILSSLPAFAQTSAKISCGSPLESSRASTVGSSSRTLPNRFELVLRAGETLQLSRFTGEFEPPHPDCVGIGCVQPKYEGVYLIKFERGTLNVYDGKRNLVFTGEGRLDFSEENGFICEAGIGLRR